MPLGPRVVTPGLFLSLGADLQRDLGGITQGYDSAIGALVVDGGAGLTVPDRGALSDATNGAGDVVPGSANDPLAGAVDSGGAIASDAATQAGDLPGPDSSEPDVGLDAPIEHEPAAPEDPGGKNPPPPPAPEPPAPPSPTPGPPPGETNVREAIRQLYLELLFREPDQGGWDNWYHEMVDNGHSLDWVRARIMESEEYRQLHGG